MIHELWGAEVGRYYDDGFLIVEDLFSREEVAAMAAAAERLRAVGRDLAATLPASERKAETQQVERAGSQFVFGGANGSLRLLRVVWAGCCEPAFLAWRRDLRLTPIVGQLLCPSLAVHLLNPPHSQYPHERLDFD